MIKTRHLPGMHKHLILPSVCSSLSSKEDEVPLDLRLLLHRRHHSRLREENRERPEEKIPFVWQIVVICQQLFEWSLDSVILTGNYTKRHVSAC